MKGKFWVPCFVSFNSHRPSEFLLFPSHSVLLPAILHACTLFLKCKSVLCVCVCVCLCVCACAHIQSPSHVRLFATPWAVATRLLRPWDFSRQENWNRLPSPPPGDLLAWKNPMNRGAWWLQSMGLQIV